MPAKTFDPWLRAQEIVLVGLGGTGCQWARSIARIVYSLKQSNRSVPQVKFIDPDKVEAHNVGRQLFTPADVGHYKAEVLARRFSFALGLEIRWYAEPVDAQRHFVSHGSIVCGAVDNHFARRELARVEGIWLDAGNHANGGQVIIGNSADRNRVLAELNGDEPTVRHLPNAALLFPELLEQEPAAAVDTATNASCAELAEAGTQSLLVNDFQATIAAQYLYQLLYRQPIQSFITYVDLERLTMRSLPISPEHLLPYLLEQPEAPALSADPLKSVAPIRQGGSNGRTATHPTP